MCRNHRIGASLTSQLITDSDVRSTRSKRRIVLNEPNDENENPFVRAKVVEGESDKPTNANARKTRGGSATRAVPAKHGPTEALVSISPSKIDSHFKIGKGPVTVYGDGKQNTLPAPKTPRHRDSISHKVTITPRHRALATNAQSTPQSPKTPSSRGIAIYSQARQLFSRCSNPGPLIGRDDERHELSTFINASLGSRSAGCVYVSGPPGTGKSALVHEVLQQYEDEARVKTSFVNCMSIRSSQDLSNKLSEDLGLVENAALSYLQPRFAGNMGKDCQKYLVILDEVDQLADLNLELLYNLFEWSMAAKSRLILIGIANALDLTDRLLPRLKSRSLKPKLLPFMPYSAGQIAEVLSAKLKSLSSEPTESVPLIHPAAIQLCAKKVGSQTGDLRKAFDICRRAIDLVEQETCEKNALLWSPSKTPLMENVNLSSPPTPSSLHKVTAPAYTLETAPRATIAHVAKITAQVFGNGTVQRLGTMNLQQKAVLCALSALEKRKRDDQLVRTVFATPSKHNSSAPSIKQVFEVYNRLCKRDNLLHPLTALEFRDVISGLEALGLTTAIDGKKGGFTVPITPSRTPSRSGKNSFGVQVSDDKLITSAVGHKELSSALEGPGAELLRAILNGDVLL